MENFETGIVGQTVWKSLAIEFFTISDSSLDSGRYKRIQNALAAARANTDFIRMCIISLVNLPA